MKNILLILGILAATCALALDPAKITCTNFREEAVSEASDASFYRGDVIHFTNCVMYAGTDTDSAVQDLTGLTVILSWGDKVQSSTSVTGTASTATSGVWNATVTLGASEAAKTYFQMKLTNSTDVFVYPFKTITTKEKL